MHIHQGAIYSIHTTTISLLKLNFTEKQWNQKETVYKFLDKQRYSTKD